MTYNPDWRTLCAALVDAYYGDPFVARWVFGEARKRLNGETPPDAEDSIYRLTSQRAILNPLLRHGITTLSELKRLGPEGLMRVDNLGTKRVAWIWDMLSTLETTTVNEASQ